MIVQSAYQQPYSPQQYSPQQQNQPQNFIPMQPYPTSVLPPPPAYFSEADYQASLQPSAPYQEGKQTLERRYVPQLQQAQPVVLVVPTQAPPQYPPMFSDQYAGPARR